MWKTCVTLALLICVQVCAHGPLLPRIKGGADAQKKAWPWMVSLHDPTCHFCGGSLISSRWVLSAAHCFIGDNLKDMDKDSIRVYLGKITQHGDNKNEIVNFVQKIYIHNSYDRKTDNNDHDIALLHLSSAVTFNDYISPLCLLAQRSDFPAGTSSRIKGWGQIEHRVNLPYPGTLQEAEVFVVDNIDCETQLNTYINQLNNPIIQTNTIFTKNMICAKNSAGFAAAYCGDSGGPMMSKHCSKWVQSGINSWSFKCSSSFPNVFTRVSQYQQWITDTIRNHPGSSSQDLPQFVDLNSKCPPDSGIWNRILRWCCCMRGEE